MTGLRWARIIPSLTALVVGCGADKKAPPSEDTNPPDFSGANAAEVLSEGKVRVTWDAASDDQTPPGQIAYRVYRATRAGGQVFEGARHCRDAPSGMRDGGSPDSGASADPVLAPCYIVAPSGARGVSFTDILPGIDYHFVARAIDAAGNQDDNTAEVSARTQDESAPQFGGVRKVTATGARSLLVEWGDGYDGPVPASLLVYDVYLNAGSPPDPDSSTPTVTSAPGENHAQLTGLEPLTTYYVIVRARDPDGNVGGTDRFLGVTTPEGIPPAFDGVKRAHASFSTVKLYWTPGTDNTTIAENIVYDIYESLQSRRQNFDAPPTYTSAPGVASHLVENLERGTDYYYVVRARDVAGNRDLNVKEVSARTQVQDSSPPTFNGVTSVSSGGTPTSVVVRWGAASDESPVEFDVYFGTSPGVPLSEPTTTTKLDEVTFTNLQPGRTYYAVVRARDIMGNIDGNTREVSGQPGQVPALPPDAAAPDTVAPEYGGGLVVALDADNTQSLNVSFTAATDDVYGPSDIRYHVCASVEQADCVGAAFNTHVRATTAWGATSVRVNGLDPRTPYYVFVRPEDRAGNMAPTTDFLRQATATSWRTNVRLLLFDKCISCHSGADRILIGQEGAIVRDTLRFDQVADIRDVGGAFPEPSACADPPPEDGCYLKLVDPFRPEYSLIYRKTNPIDLRTPPFRDDLPNRYGGLREPRDATPYLTAEEDSILHDWIAQGAKGD